MPVRWTAVFIFITLVGLIFFLITQGSLIYFAVKYRRKKGGSRRDALHHREPLAGDHLHRDSVAAGSGHFLLRLCGFHDIRTPPADAVEIQVTARQWLYQFTYPDGRQEINEVRVPLGKPVKFVMKSHGRSARFLPSPFRVKQDILPGRYTYLWVQPEKEGRFDIFCTQYCGTGHSVMRAILVVMGEEYGNTGRNEESGSQTLAEKGEELVEHSGCLACHSLDGTAKVGPTRKGSTAGGDTLGRQNSVVDEDYIRESLLSPEPRL